MESSSSLTNNDNVLSTAWEACCDAYRNCKQHFSVKYLEGDNNFLFFSFPGSNDVEDIDAESKFGECKVNQGNHLFTSLKATATDEPAIVHKPALNRFLFLLENTEFQKKVNEVGKKSKTSIVFTGHSVGGAVAALATIWLLEQRANSSPPICITFGSPLLGDDIFGQAIRRERWACQFYHVISRCDIVPRILLAPSKSICGALKVLVPYWWRSMTNAGTRAAPLLSESTLLQESVNLVASVTQHASAVASYRSAMCMAPNNMLLSGISSVVKQSPYRPFGSCVFVSENGAICTENYEALLQILYYTLQSSDPCLIAEACVSQHIEYGSMLQHMQNWMDVDIPLFDNMATAKQLEALGLRSQNVEARLALEAAGEVMKRLRSNSEKKATELGTMRTVMEELEAYKKSSKITGIGYYDSFKRHEEKRDFQANLARLRLAGFWDEIMDMVERKELPDNFESEEKWIEAGSAYRLLVEPLDIANYYRLGKHEDTGHYLLKGRPRRYTLLQKWLQGHQIRRGEGQGQGQTNGNIQSAASFTNDSCLWAYLEEFFYTIAKTQSETQGITVSHQLSPELKSSLESFEKRVKTLIDNKQLSDDFLLEESSLVKWWKMLPPPLRSGSILYDFMEGGGRKTYCMTTTTV